MLKAHAAALAAGTILSTAILPNGVYRNSDGKGYHDAHGNPLDKDDVEGAVTSYAEAAEKHVDTEETARDTEFAHAIRRDDRMRRREAERYAQRDAEDEARAAARRGDAPVGTSTSEDEQGFVKPNAPDGAPEPTHPDGKAIEGPASQMPATSTSAPKLVPDSSKSSAKK